MAPEGTAAQFFDGQTAARHHVQVALSDDRQALVITGESLAEPLRWRLMDLRALSDTSDKARLTVTRHTTSDDEMPRDIARLVILDPDLIAWLHKKRAICHGSGPLRVPCMASNQVMLIS